MATADTLPMSPIAAHTTTTPTHKSQHYADGPLARFDSDSSPLSSPDAEAENKYSFTPNRLPPPKPRAWQRQPSQPFAPRHGAQKIWRRAPLRNISDEVNRRWRRGSGEIGQNGDAIGDGVVRPTKRMKVGGPLDGKENEEVEIGVDTEKYESWGWGLMEGAQGVLATPQLDGANDAPFEDANVLPKNHEGLEITATEIEIEQDETPPPADATSDIDQPDGASEQNELKQVHQPVLQHVHSRTESEEDHDISMASTLDIGPESVTDAEPSDDSDKLNNMDNGATWDAEENSEQMVQDEAAATEPPAAPEMCFDITSAPAENTSSHISHHSTLATDQLGSSVSDNADTEDMSSPAAGAALPLSNQAALSPVKQTTIQEIHDNAFFTTSSAPQPTRPQSQPEEDDTAFLQQFLQRAKQAREKNPALQLYRPVGEQVKRHLIDQQNQGVSPQKNDRKRPRSPEPDDLLNLDNLEDATITTTVLVPDLQDLTEKSSPAGRRSSRISANTKLPRPQRPTALPNTISLRRLNGTEFISMAKQRTDADKAVSATRNNTRKNKGSALSVQDKLKQMSLGFADEANKHAPEPDRKQKPRVRKKTGVKYDRVAWAVKIARYQEEDGEEHTLTLDGDAQAQTQDAQASESDDDDYIPPPPKAESDLSEESQTASRSSTTTPKKSTRSSASRSGSKASKSRSKATSEEATSTEPTTPVANTTTKRKRAEASGSVNGTPAPKRGMAALLETARENEGVAAALGRSRRESRADASMEETTEDESMAGTRGSKRLRLRKSGD